MKVAIVYDSKFIRMVIKQIVQSDPSFEVIWEAENGKDAFLENENYMADLIISDVEMPIMDGVELLKNLREKSHRSECLIVSGFHRSDGKKIIEAFRLGAIGFISKNKIGKGVNLNEFREDILDYLGAIEKQIKRNILSPKSISKSQVVQISSKADMLLIAGSAGSLEPLEEILRRIDYFHIPIIAAIHMPEGVDEFFVNRLNKFYCDHGFKIRISNDGSIGENSVSMLKGGFEAELRETTNDFFISYIPPKIGKLFTPNIDSFLKGVSEKNKLCDVVILSGLCSDACEGSKIHKENGGLIFVQDPSTAVAKTMPLSVIAKGYQDMIAEPKKIGDLLAENYSLSHGG